MDSNIMIIENQIITMDKVIEVADYLKSISDHYNNLIKEDKEKNNGAYFSNATYNYYSYSSNKVEYTVEFTDGRKVKTEDENVFKDELKEPKYIQGIYLHLYISYSDNNMNETTEHVMSFYISIWGNHVDLNTSSKFMDKELYNAHSYITGIFQKGEERLSKIVKDRSLVRLLFSLAVGSVLSYIPLLILFILRMNNGEALDFIFGNGIVFSFFHWGIIFIAGLLLGYPIISSLYKNIEPDISFKNPEYRAQQMEEYKKGNEILIGKYVDNLEKRKTITKYYDTSKKVLLAQIIITIVLMILLSVFHI